MFKRIKAAWGAFLEQPYKQAAQDIEKEVEKQKFETKPENNISEPVISFVECVKKTPGRFSVYKYDLYDGTAYSITDRKTKEHWRMGAVSVILFGSYKLNSTDWLTQDEKLYVIEELSAFYKKRQNRKVKLDIIRKERENTKERKRLMEVYCE